MDNQAYDHDMDVRGGHNKVKWYFNWIYSAIDINDTIVNDDVSRPPVHQS